MSASISARFNETFSAFNQKMKFFDLVRRHYTILGISATNQSTQRYPLNKRVLFGLSLFVCSFVSHFVYIFRVASGFMDYMVGICTVSGCTIMFVAFVDICLEKNLLFESFDNVEKLIDTSEPVPICTKFLIIPTVQNLQLFQDKMIQNRWLCFPKLINKSND